MNKESEVLETSVLLKFIDDWLKRYDVCNIDYNFYKIKQALERLEAIDNANPSEALESLEEIRDFRYGKEKLLVCQTQMYTTIKQALLKAQEPKKYLKWEDLEFSIEKQMMAVLLNGTKYTLILGRNVHIDKLAFLRNGEINYYFLEADKQFFNDLHLERLEE